MSDSKIGFITNGFPRISETFIVRQAQYLDAIVIASSLDVTEFNNYDFDYDNAIALGNLAESPRGLKNKVIGKLLHRPYKPWPKHFNERFEKVLKEKKIDVVLAAFGPNGINALPICKKLKLPLYVQFLGYDASALIRNKWYQKKILEVLEYSTAAVVLYGGMEKPFVELGAEPQKFYTINVGVPIEQFRPSFKHNNVRTIFLSVGRFVEKKAPLVTIESFLRCANSNPNVELHMVGGGELFEDARDLVARSGHMDKIKFHGPLAQEDLLPLYSKADVFLQHSVTGKDGNTEGWPVGIAEACASGLPVISTKHAGIVEQVIHGETGFLVDEHDAQGMADYMLRLSLDYQLVQEMGIAARRHIENKGSLEKQLKLLHNLLNNVL